MSHAGRVRSFSDDMHQWKCVPKTSFLLTLCWVGCTFRNSGTGELFVWLWREGTGKWEREVLITGKGKALPELPEACCGWRRTGGVSRTRLVLEDSSKGYLGISSAYLTTGKVTRDYNVSSQEKRSLSCK